MILDPEDYIARLACALALDDLAEAKRVMDDMSGDVSPMPARYGDGTRRHVHLEAIQRGQTAARSRCPSPST